MPIIMVDIETDGPIPGNFSMVCFGAVIVEDNLDKTFYGKLKPISEHWNAQALAVSGFSREETLQFEPPKSVMDKFANWIQIHSESRPLFFSDNNGFDWQFINWYFHHFLGHNPFGHSSSNLGSMYKGMVKDSHKNCRAPLKIVIFLRVQGSTARRTAVYVR